MKILYEKKPLMIAHRGASGYELENTKEAFIAAGNRSFYGIETDVRVTKDGYLIVFHDADLKRLKGIEDKIRDLTLKEIKSVSLTKGFNHIDYYQIPTFKEYLKICKYYQKKAIIELKHGFNEKTINQLILEIQEQEMLDESIIISFNMEYLINIRKKLPHLQIQYLTGEELDDERINLCINYRFDIDLQKDLVTPGIINLFHHHKLKVNAWTVDNVDEAKRLILMNIDYITSNFLE